MADVHTADILTFPSRRGWRQWLAKNHSRSRGVWVRFFKKNSGIASVTYDEALDEAICYGWIDSRLRPLDEKSWMRRFTPRRPKSLWSRRNVERASGLMKAGRMTRAGIAEVQAAKADGRWKRAYDSGRTMSVPADFLRRLDRDRHAKGFFKTLGKADLYAIAWRLQTSRTPETREQRIRKILAMLARGESLHG